MIDQLEVDIELSDLRLLLDYSQSANKLLNRCVSHKLSLGLRFLMFPESLMGVTQSDERQYNIRVMMYDGLDD